MDNDQPRAYIGTNTVLFAQSIMRSLEDMIGLSPVLNKESFREKAFSTGFDMIIYIHFAGIIQGDYLISMDESTAAKLIEVYEDGMTNEALKEMREDYTGFIKELLNTAVGLSIPELEQIFGNLTYSSSIVVYGKIEFPDVTAGDLIIESKAGNIQCGFAIDLVKLKIGQKLEECMCMIRDVRNQAAMARKEVDTILQIVPTCLVAVSPDGTILPGYSRQARALAGIEPDGDIVGLHLHDFLSLVAEDRQAMASFFTFLSEKECLSRETFPFDEVQRMCDGNFHTKHGKIFKLEWLPMVNEEKLCLEKLIVIVETIVI